MKNLHPPSLLMRSCWTLGRPRFSPISLAPPLLFLCAFASHHSSLEMFWTEMTLRGPSGVRREGGEYTGAARALDVSHALMLLVWPPPHPDLRRPPKEDARFPTELHRCPAGKGRGKKRVFFIKKNEKKGGRKGSKLLCTDKYVDFLARIHATHNKKSLSENASPPEQLSCSS
ncbi:hypothetical protein LY76DRAFT_270580 [Colletotrichum caudatum]|nr:hypothetical protein LY76DRAFT_270580 [Colletotrichum caudatum]